MNNSSSFASNLSAAIPLPAYVARMWYILSIWPDNYMTIYSIFLWIFCISGVLTNGLILYVLYRFKELRYGLHMIMMMIFYDLVHNLAGGESAGILRFVTLFQASPRHSYTHLSFRTCCPTT